MSLISRIDREHSSLIAQQAADCDETDRRHHVSALVGMSMGNSYFRPKLVDQLVVEAHAEFDRVGFMLPDIPSIETLVAKGMERDIAEKRSRLAFNNISTKIRHNALQCMLLRWKSETAVEESSLYQKALGSLNRMFFSNEAFRKDIHAATRDVLAFHYGAEWETFDGVERGKKIGVGKNFLLMELACILSSYERLGSDICLYIYHRPMPVLQKLLDGAYGEVIDIERRHTGYLVYEPFEEVRSA